MEFTDVPDDTLDNQDFEEIGEDNYPSFPTLGIPDIDSNLLEEFLELDIPFDMDEIMESNKACEILNRILQDGDESFLDTLGPDLEVKSIGSKKY